MYMFCTFIIIIIIKVVSWKIEREREREENRVKDYKERKKNSYLGK